MYGEQWLPAQTSYLRISLLRICLSYVRLLTRQYDLHLLIRAEACLPCCPSVKCILLCLQASSGQGAELAATDSSVTDTESMSDVQLLRSGGDERTLFKLTLQASTCFHHVAYCSAALPAPELLLEARLTACPLLPSPA